MPARLGPDYLDASYLLRGMLSPFGFLLRQRRGHAGTLPIMTFVSRHRNGYYFNGCKQDTTAEWLCRFPDGAPILTGRETVLQDGLSRYALERSFHAECRLFARQRASGTISCIEAPPFPTGKQRLIRVTGLQDADLTFFPPLDRFREVLVKQGSRELEAAPNNGRASFSLTHVSGSVDLAW